MKKEPVDIAAVLLAARAKQRVDEMMKGLRRLDEMHKQLKRKKFGLKKTHPYI